MADLSLDLARVDSGLSTYKDLLVVNGDLVLTSDANPNGTNPILQNVIQRLRMFLGEWFLDNTQGIPYFQQILIKNPDQSKIDAIFMNAILGTPGIVQLNSYSFVPNTTKRVLTITFVAQTTNGVVQYSGNLTITNGGQ